MITILSNSRPRGGRRRAVGWRDAGCKPALANPQGMKRIATLLVGLLSVYGVIFGQTATIKVASTNPANNEKINVLSSINIDFDLSDIFADYPDVPQEDFGIMNMTRTINVYKGEDATGELIASQQIKSVLNTSANFVPGKRSTEITFDQDIILETDQPYCIVIPAKTYSAATLTTKYSTTYNPEPISWLVYGGSNSQITELLILEYTPVNKENLDALSIFELKFNQDISILDGSKAQLIEGTEIIAEALISVDSNNSTIAVADFQNTTLYNSHTYTVVIPADVICSATDDTNTYRGLSSTLYGTSVKSFGYGRINPRNNAEISYLANIEVPVNCSDSEYLGRDFKATMQLYKMDGENAVAVGEPVECVVNGNAKGLTAPFYMFDLEPSSSYQVVLEADQFCLWDYETQKPMRDTANERLVLNYTTPAVIEPLPRQSFKSAVPDGSEPIKNLTSLRVDFEPYFFEDVFYYPVFPTTLTEGYNLVKFVDVTTGDESSFPVEIKWDEANNYWLENSAEINYTLLKDHDYQVVIPAGMFRCRLAELGDNSANEEYVINLKGATRTEFDVTYTLAEVGSLKTVVGAGKTVTVNLGGTEDWKVAEVLFNGEAVETEGEAYTTPAIEDDATIEVAYEYAHEIDYDFTSGVAEITDCPFGISHEGDMLVISGVKEGDNISIYAVNGMKMAALSAVPAGNDVVSISLPTGQVYIILINSKSVKVRH